MESIFSFEWLAALGGILLMDLLLSGDNAILIALVCKNLPHKQKKKAMIVGGMGAVLIRITLTIFATRLLAVPYLQFLGGLALLYIAFKLLTDREEDAENETSPDSFSSAVKTILLADLIMSVDNILSMAGIANTVDGDRWTLILCGLLISIPIVLCGAQFFLFLLQKFPVILYFGAGILAFTAGKMIALDQAVGRYFAPFVTEIEIFLTIFVLLLGLYYNRKQETLTENKAVVSPEHSGSTFFLGGIEMNTLKTAVLMALLTGLLVAVGAMFGGRSGASIMLLISLGINFFSYWYSDSIVLKAYDAQEVTPTQAPELYKMVEKLVQRADLPMPKVYIIDTDIPNAFATGRNPAHAAVAVTTGIMRTLQYDELSGVIAHELAHIKHRDTLISTIVASVAGVISWIGSMAQWAAIFGVGRSEEEEDGGGMLGMLFTIIVAPLAAFLIQMAISRSREFDADETGGQICGNPLSLAAALEKIDYYAKNAVMQQATPSTAHLFIINPLAGSGQKIMNLFSTHPATEVRVARLKEQATR